MADYRERSSSIFSDDDRNDRGRDDRWRNDRWRGDQARGDHARSGASPEDRGFFERAGDEIRSWFGDDEAEHRREADARRYERENPGTDRWSDRTSNMPVGGHTADRSYSRARMDDGQGRSGQHGYRDTGYGESGYGGAGYGRTGFGSHEQTGTRPAGASHHDESYRRWRDQQIAALDSEYDAFRQHRQTQFEQDFSTFRQDRQSGITSGGPSLAQADTGAMSLNAEGESEGASTPGSDTQSRSRRS